jgi:D-3-phosphoglycerate dehydrogenase
MSAPCLAVITDCEFASCDPERRELAGVAEVRKYSCRSEEQVIEVAAEADALLVQYAPITRRVIHSLKNCRVIGRYGIGVDMIDVEAATQRRIPVVNVPEYCVEEVSDHTLALMLAAIRKILILHGSIAEGRWDFSVAVPLPRIRDLTVGLLALGKIARRVAEKLRGFGCAIIAHDPFADPQAAAVLGIQLVDLQTLLERSDLISVHAPLTKETRHLFDREAFGRMKRSAWIVNTSRGALIDESALIFALDQGLIAGAALDVLEQEPVSNNNPLVGRKNVLLTPHSAFYSAASLLDLQILTARGVAQVLRGQKPDYLVNSKVDPEVEWEVDPEIDIQADRGSDPAGADGSAPGNADHGAVDGTAP